MAATILVHVALLAYAAAAATYLAWLVRPREWLVPAGRALLLAGLLLHLTSFGAAVSLAHGEGLARAGFGSDAWKGGQLFSLLAAATVAGYLVLDFRYGLPVAGAFVAPVTVAVMVPAHLVHSGTRAIAPALTHSTALALHVGSAAAGTAALALAFAPKTLAAFQAIREARQLRGQRTGWRAAPALLLPLLLTTLERALQYGESLDARGFGSGRRSRYRPFHWTAADLLVVIASLGAIVVIALLPAVAYNPYVDLVPAAPDPDRLLAVALVAVPAVTASLLRVDHARHRA